MTTQIDTGAGVVGVNAVGVNAGVADTGVGAVADAGVAIDDAGVVAEEEVSRIGKVGRALILPVGLFVGLWKSSFSKEDSVVEKIVTAVSLPFIAVGLSIVILCVPNIHPKS